MYEIVRFRDKTFSLIHFEYFVFFFLLNIVFFGVKFETRSILLKYMESYYYGSSPSSCETL